METNGENEKRILQKNLARFLIKDVFNLVDEDDLIKIVRSQNPTQPDIWYHKGKELPHVKAESLKKQAKAFKQDMLWQILKNEIQYWVHQQGTLKATTTDDILAAKVMQYFVDLVETKLDQMSR